jgi:hypothetical protein
MPKKRSNSASGNYEIGYRRPPKRYQFKRGRTANPAGINRTLLVNTIHFHMA